jgi:hypothetical protein
MQAYEPSVNRVGIYFTRGNDLIPEEANAEGILAIDTWVWRRGISSF